MFLLHYASHNRIEKMMWQMQEHWLNHLKQSTSLKIQFAMETIASSVQSMHSCAEGDFFHESVTMHYYLYYL